MHSYHLCRIYSIPVDNNIPRQITHRDHPVGSQHALPFQIVYQLIHILATSIEFRSMHMNNQGFARYLFRGNTRSIRQPVVRMNHVKFLLTRYGGRYNSITGDFFHQICPVFSGKSILIFKSDPFLPLSRFDPFIHFFFKMLRIHIGNQVRSDFHKIDIFPIFFYIDYIEQSLDITCIDNFRCTLIFIPTGFWHNKQHFYTLFSKPFRQT